MDQDDTSFFADLDAEIAREMEAKSARAQLAMQKKRLEALARRGTPDAEIEHRLLLNAIRKLEDQQVWHTDAAVVLFLKQHCVTCGSVHRFFQGWMTGQKHRTDKTAHRLLKGRPTEHLPVRVEEHDVGDVVMCSNCVESCLAIDAALEAAKEKLNQQEIEKALAARKESNHV